MAGRLRGNSTQGGGAGSHDFFAYNAANAVWNGAAFVTWADADFASYRVTATESGTSGRYTGDEPAGAVYYELRTRGATLALSTVVWVDTLVLPDALVASQADVSALPALLASAANINVYAPAAGVNLDLYRGDSYENAGGRAITVTKSSLETTWPTTLTTVDLYCKPTPQTLATYASAASLGPVSCTVTQSTGSSQAFRVDLTSVQLATLQAAVQTPANGYTYWIVANRATAPATLRSGPLNVRPDYTAT